MNLGTKRMTCLLVAIASVLTIVGSVSYAYFTAMGEVAQMDATLKMIEHEDSDHFYVRKTNSTRKGEKNKNIFKNFLWFDGPFL